MLDQDSTIAPKNSQALNAALSQTFGRTKFNLRLDAALIGEAACDQVISCLDSKARKMIKKYRADTTSYIVLRGFDVDGFVGATPPNGAVSPNSIPLIVETLLGLNAACGFDPLAYEHENDGHIIRCVAPTEASSGAASSHGSSKTFDWHTDNPSCDPAPSVLSFVCARNHEQVATDILPLEKVMSCLSQATKQILTENRFRQTPPASSDPEAQDLIDQPILWQANDKWHICYDEQSSVPMSESDSAAHAALACLRMSFLEAEARGGVVSVTLQKGDYLSFRNARVLHRRKAFTPHPSPSRRRWLVRVYGIEAHTGLDHPEAITKPFVIS